MPNQIPAPSLAVVKKLAQQLDLLPQREAGQNFLIDPSVALRVLKEADIKKTDTVLEIGPGFGWLTQQITERADKVIAVELEKRFIPWLHEHLPEVKLINESVLTCDLTGVVQDQGYILVSFLPYSITAKAFRQFLTQPPRPKRIVFVIQKEVAERICAEAGEHSKLSILVQRYSTPRLVKTVAPEKFWPQPAVDSAIIVCDLTTGADASADDFFWRLVRIGFSSRRKTLLNNLVNGYHFDRATALRSINSADLSEKARPQELTLAQWDALAAAVDKELSDR